MAFHQKKLAIIDGTNLENAQSENSYRYGKDRPVHTFPINFENTKNNGMLRMEPKPDF